MVSESRTKPKTDSFFVLCGDLIQSFMLSLTSNDSEEHFQGSKDILYDRIYLHTRRNKHEAE